MEESSGSSVNRLLVGGSLVNRLLVGTSTSWSLPVVGGSSVSRSLGIGSSVRSLGGGSSVNRISVGDDISGYDSTSKRKTFNTNDTNNNKKQATDGEKTKRITLTKAQKAEICCLRKKGYTQLALANKFKIGESTVSKILKQQDYFFSIDPNSTQAKSKRNRSAKYPQLEEVLSLWVSKAEAHYQTITGAIIQRKAFQFAKKLKIDNFGGSEGWLSNFKKRFHIKEYTRQGESTSAPINDIPRY
ncbi:373_t:CDS:1, partial [Dentiscutata heterogama]